MGWPAQRHATRDAGRIAGSSALAAKHGEHRLLREVVAEDEIASIVARWTGIPVSRLKKGEREKLPR